MVEYAVMVCAGEVIQPEHLPLPLRFPQAHAARDAAPAADQGKSAGAPRPARKKA